MNTREMIQNSINYIERNITADITVQEICDLAGYSYAHYCRLFREMVGLSPSEYINRRKLLHAVYEINNGNKKIDTALRFGFETYAGFYKAFYREFSCSPSDFFNANKGTKPYKINILQEEHILISKNRIKKILKNWDLQNGNILNIYNENTGRQNENAYFIGEDYIIKFSADLWHIQKNIKISELLIKADLSSAKIIKTCNGDDYLQSGELYFILQSRIKGLQLKCSDIFCNADIAYKTGVYIAHLHNALKVFDEVYLNDADIFNSAENDALPNVRKIMNFDKHFIDDYLTHIHEFQNALPRQTIHRDMNPSNILFNNGEFAGFVDFDLTEKNIRIFDICYFATSILSECLSDKTIKTDNWTNVFKQIVCGYNHVNALTEQEKHALPYVVYSLQLICINYFSKFDKYQELAKTNINMLNYIINTFQDKE